MSKGPWYRKLAGVFPALFSCRRYTELASRSMDEKLGPSEMIFHRFHHIICMVCRRFKRQIVLVNKAIQKIDSEKLAQEKGEEDSMRLPDTWKKKISEQIDRR